MKKEKLIEQLKQIVKIKGLKYTKQREIVLEVVNKSKKHLTTEEIYNHIKKKGIDQNIGIATVYRSLLFLEEVALISSITLEKGIKKYEINNETHHDHLVCIRCDKIIEFINETIENEQKNIARSYGFELMDHTMYLYGVCKDCKND
ncbi:MAG: transcriptional repressor [Campylobacteraceae bacterium 4484_166]|nr:MAG: transcriptional repressor [Campylobacteraceae bacterium 4484_166]